jgi:hypothetical protein
MLVLVVMRCGCSQEQQEVMGGMSCFGVNHNVCLGRMAAILVGS